MTDEDQLARFDREWPEFLNEVRVALPGVQLLFAFLLTAPFSANFPHAAVGLRRVYFICFLCTTAACAFLIAPSVYHRLHWRRNVRDKEEMLRTCNRLAIAGVCLLAVAMACAVFVVSEIMANGTVAILTSAASAIGFFGLWFALPLIRRGRDRNRHS
jgi:hypothetical protein